jgi:hypothetical protein
MFCPHTRSPLLSKEALNADVDEHNIAHFSCIRNLTKHALETVGTAVQSREKKPRSKQVSSCVVFVYRYLFAYSSLSNLQLWFGVHVDHQMNYLHFLHYSRWSLCGINNKIMRI